MSSAETDAVSRQRGTGPTRTARAEASAWIVRLHGPHRTPELEAGFRAWLAASQENARQFERVTGVWEAGAVPVPGVARVAREANRVQPRRWLLAAVLTAFVIGVGGWGVRMFWFSQNPSYITGVGEQRILRLSDGSRLTLNSDSGIIVSYRHNARRVTIDHGEAFFEVAKDASRPFRVRVGGQEVEAIGTSFVVRREPQQITVTLVKGKVTVSDLDQSKPGTMLTEGQRLRVVNGHIELDQPRIEAVTAWLRGEVMLDGTPLADAIAEMNRYDQRQLVIDGPVIAAVRISGVYHIGDSALFADMVARLYGLGTQRLGGRIHLTSSAEEADDRE